MHQRMSQADRLTADRLNDRYLMLMHDLQGRFQEGVLDEVSYSAEAERLRRQYDREMRLVGTSTRVWTAPPARAPHAVFNIAPPDRALAFWGIVIIGLSALFTLLALLVLVAVLR